MQRQRPAEVEHDRAAVIADDTRVPEEDKQAGVIAVAEEGLWMGRYEGAVEIGQNADLVVAADGRDDRRYRGVGEGGVQVGSSILRVSVHLPRRRVLDGHKSE